MKEVLKPLIMDRNFESMIHSLPDNILEIYEITVITENEPFTPLYIWNGFYIKEKDLTNIIQTHKEIEISTIKMTFENKFAAMAWIYKNLIDRNSLTPERKKYLIGKRYEAEKASHGGRDRFRGNQYKRLVKIDDIITTHNTRNVIALSTGTSEAYVKQSYDYSRGLDAAEDVYPGITEDIMLKSIKIPACYVSVVYKLPMDKRKGFLDELLAKYNNPKRYAERCVNDG